MRILSARKQQQMLDAVAKGTISLMAHDLLQAKTLPEIRAKLRSWIEANKIDLDEVMVFE